MSTSISKLDQAIRDLIEAYSEIDNELEDKFGDDEEAYSNALVEAFETSIEGAIEDSDFSTARFAHLIGCLSESLEQLDPSAFEDDDAELEDVEDDDDVDYDDEDEDLDLDEDEDEEDE